ncbi:MAG: hypothetical protein KJ734_04995, partial [Chloroflexi bacterium]|nr:hypothetical protein [Chloroflexota bacterium]
MSWDDPADKRRSRRPRSVNLAGPLILITLGLLFLGANLGVLGASPWQLLWQWWPLILVVIGIEVLLGLLGRWSRVLSAVLGLVVAVGVVALTAYLLMMGPQMMAGEPAYTSRFTQERGDVGRAEIMLDLSLGTFRVSALPPDSGNLTEGEFAGSAGQDSDNPPVQRAYQETGGVAVLTLKSGGPQFRMGQSDWPAWHLRLSPDLPLTLKVDAVMGTY